MKVHRSRLLERGPEGDKSILLLWDCAPHLDWASQVEGIAKNGEFPLLRVQRISEWSGCELTLSPTLLILAFTAQNKWQGLQSVRVLRSSGFNSPILSLSDTNNHCDLAHLMEAGFSDFIPIPLRPWEVLARLKRWVAVDSNSHRQKDLSDADSLFSRIVGESAVLKCQIAKALRYGPCDAAVLICGETGTGKEVFARAIHDASLRKLKPFVAVNCGALPSDLIENELFGHQSGAFTGAQRDRSGLVEQAQDGTLFLDEIDSLPMSAQAKLLRFLEEREYRPLGAGTVKHANVRIISASNADLQTGVVSNRFREDLYFRLNVLRLDLPPLRERREDIPLLANHLLNRHEMPTNRLIATLSPDALDKLAGYDWPGNVRELENVIERALALSSGDTIEASDIDIPLNIPTATSNSFKMLKAKVVYEFEHRYLKDMLTRHRGNISRAARSAETNRRAFFELLRKHNLTNHAQHHASPFAQAG